MKTEKNLNQENRKQGSTWPLFLTLGSLCGFGLGGAFPQQALAENGFERGGANAVICFDTPSIPDKIHAKDAAGNLIDPSIRDSSISHITSVEVLDLFEAKYSRGFDTSLRDNNFIQPRRGESSEAYARRLIERTKDLAPDLYQKLLDAMENLPVQEAIRVPYGLESVNDYNLVGRVDLENCVVGTIAMQQDGRSSSVELYLDARLMDHAKHGEWSRKLTYFHELVYYVARNSFNQSDSQGARKVVGTLLQSQLGSKKLFKTLTTAGMLSDQDATVNQLNPQVERVVNLFLNTLNRTLFSHGNGRELFRNIPEVKTNPRGENPRYKSEMIENLESGLWAPFGNSSNRNRNCDRYVLDQNCWNHLVEITQSGPSFFGPSQEEVDLARAIFAKFPTLDSISNQAEEKFNAYAAGIKSDLLKKGLALYLKQFQARVLTLPGYTESEKSTLDRVVLENLQKPENFFFGYNKVPYDTYDFALNIHRETFSGEAIAGPFPERPVPVYP